MELWDLYDENRLPLGRTHPRGEPVPKGAYHLAVIVVILNARGEVLLTRRAREKDACPGWWENTGGSALAGETSREAITRELREETGIAARPEAFTPAAAGGLPHRRPLRHLRPHLGGGAGGHPLPGGRDRRRPLGAPGGVGGRGGRRRHPVPCPERGVQTRAVPPHCPVSAGPAGVFITERKNHMAYTVGMVSLGCAKNQVDGEMLLAALEEGGFQPVEDPAEADILLVNTCGFIESAKRESIEAILEAARLKEEGAVQKVVVTGCLSERYREEIHKELPEVDGVFGIGANGDIAAFLREMLQKGFAQAFPEKEKMPLSGKRELSTPDYFAYLKIAEGCDNRCAYCAIPLIRGGYRSRPMESIEEEARALAQRGVKELNLIAQDTTRYGLDLYGEYSLAKLLSPPVQDRRPPLDPGAVLLSGLHHRRALGGDGPGGKNRQIHGHPPAARLEEDPAGHEPPGGPGEPYGPHGKNPGKGAGGGAAHHPDRRLPRGDGRGLHPACGVRPGRGL